MGCGLGRGEATLSWSMPSSAETIQECRPRPYLAWRMVTTDTPIDRTWAMAMVRSSPPGAPTMAKRVYSLRATMTVETAAKAIDTPTSVGTIVSASSWGFSPATGIVKTGLTAR